MDFVNLTFATPRTLSHTIDVNAISGKLILGMVNAHMGEPKFNKTIVTWPPIGVYNRISINTSLLIMPRKVAFEQLETMYV